MTGPLGSTGAVEADPEALLRAANILCSQAVNLSRSSQMYLRSIRVNDCGTDEISRWATPAFNEKIQPMADSITQLTELLGTASRQLVETARSYGATDEQGRVALTKLDDNQIQHLAAEPVGQTSAWLPR